MSDALNAIAGPAEITRNQLIHQAQAGALDVKLVLGLIRQHWLPAREGLITVQDCQVHRLFPKGEQELVIKYELTLRALSGDIYSQTAFAELRPGACTERREDIITKLKKTRRQQLAKNSEASDIVAIPELNLVLRFPGLDEAIPGLVLLHKPELALDVFKRTFPELQGQTDFSLHSHILNHRLGKRCIFQMTASTGDQTYALVARCLKTNDGRSQENHQFLTALWRSGLNEHNANGVRVPRSYGTDESLNAIFIEQVAGEILWDCTRWDLEHQAYIAGKALAALHCSSWRPQRNYYRQQELAMLQEWVALTAELKPELAQDLQRALYSVSQRFASVAVGQSVLTHRDYYGKQLIYDGEQCVLIDFDTLTSAEAELDLGNYIAHRLLADVSGGDFKATEIDVFLSVYKRLANAYHPARLKLWTDAALLRLACLYAQKTHWESVAERLLAKVTTP